jgi:MYXO-CTERM domain-containing protein
VRRDGDVDAFDYVALKAGLRTPAGAAADRAASAPDPAALWLLALGSLALMRRRQPGERRGMPCFARKQRRLRRASAIARRPRAHERRGMPSFARK